MKKNLRFIIIVIVIIFLSISISSHAEITIFCWFPPHWKISGQKAKAITDILGEKSGISIKPRIARNYQEILRAFKSEEYSLTYVGSFVQAIIISRDIGIPLVQNINGKQLYSGIMIYPKDEDPQNILEQYPEQIAYTVGASSGESSAKAASRGRACKGVASHTAAAGAVKVGKAKAAFVKNWWWEANKSSFPMLSVYNVPGISLNKNPDNILTVSKSVPSEIMEKIRKNSLRLYYIY